MRVVNFEIKLPSLQIVSVGAGIGVNPSVELTVKDDLNVDGTTVLEIVYDDKLGRFAAASVTVERLMLGSEVTSTTLRAVRVQEYIRAALGGAVWYRSSSGAWGPLDESREVILDSAKFGPVPDTLLWVARVYRLSEILNSTPTKDVAANFEIPYATAANWVTRARAAGLLESASG